MIKKIFLTFFLVQVVTYVTTIIGMTVDGIVTGSFLGTDALAAYGLVTPFLTVLTAMASAISVGTSTLVSSRLGRGELSEMKRCFRICFWTAFLVGVVLLAGIFALANPLATALKADGAVHGMVVDYLRGYCMGFPFIFLMVLSIPILQIIGRRKTLVVAIVSMTTVNVFMDFFNVLVWHKGMLGMALATTLSYIVAFLIALTALASKNTMLNILPEKPDGKVIKEMVSYGIPNAVSMGSRNALTIIMNGLIITIAGMKMVAAYAAIMSAMALAMSIGIGMASTVSMLSGVFSGEKDRQDLISLIRLVIRYSIIINGILALVFIVLAKFIVALFFRGDPSMLESAAMGLRVIVLSSILFSINFCIRSYYQAMKIRIAIPYAVFNCLISTLLIAYPLGHAIGIYGVWLAYPLGEILTLLVFLAYTLNRQKSEGKRSVLERFMLMPDRFYDEVEPLELPVTSMEVAVEASERVRVHMKEHGASERIAFYTSLAVEELCGNIIRHGFKGEKGHNARVKLKKDGNSWILRIRDDCRNFDPVAYVKGITPEQKTSHYGIRMIYGLADEITYLNALNLNNLLIRFTEKAEEKAG